MLPGLTVKHPESITVADIHHTLTMRLSGFGLLAPLRVRAIIIPTLQMGKLRLGEENKPV